MSKSVRLLVKDSNRVVQMNEKNAKRLAAASPNEYQILEPPTIEVRTIPPVSGAPISEPMSEADQKKSADIAVKNDNPTEQPKRKYERKNNPTT